MLVIAELKIRSLMHVPSNLMTADISSSVLGWLVLERTIIATFSLDTRPFHQVHC